MSTTALRSPTEYESQLQRYLFERSEEGRAVRVGEKEVSEQAAIVARYADLFSREQLDALRSAEESADADERERLYRLRKACEAGLLVAELAERDDALENAILAARVTFRGDGLPLRWFDRLLGSERHERPTSHHSSFLRRLTPLDSTYTKERSVEVCLRTLERLGFRIADDPNIRLDLDDRPQKSPRACVIASDPPRVVHLITRAQGGLHDYQAFLHEAGHALHYAGCDPTLPYTFRRLARDHALTEIYSCILEAITREPGWHAEHFGLSDEQAAENAEATVFLEGLLFHRYVAKLRFELGFWSRFAEDGGTPEGYAELLSAATGLRYRADGFLADMDAGFYSADYLRAWIRSTQLRSHLVREIGEDWWRSAETGELLHGLFFEGTGPSSEEVAARLDYEPLDTQPLVHELNAV